MHIMFCNFDMFNTHSQVLAIEEDGKNSIIFEGNFEDVCKYMAGEYFKGNYKKILLTGPYSYAVQDGILTYGKINYNLETIEIEVI